MNKGHEKRVEHWLRDRSAYRSYLSESTEARRNCVGDLGPHGEAGIEECAEVSKRSGGSDGIVPYVEEGLGKMLTTSMRREPHHLRLLRVELQAVALQPEVHVGDAA